MTNSTVLPVVLAGGSGSRLWPFSRTQYPKQFLPLVGEDTMIQCTLERLKGLDELLINCDDPLIVCNNDHRFIVAEQLRESNTTVGSIILEPSAHNTAPSIALAALKSMIDGADPVLLVLPADHLIQNVKAFHSSIEGALSYAKEGKLVTFGVQVTRPETGYGYIQLDDLIDLSVFELNQGCVIKCFTEKPDKETAQEYLNSGRYLWNAGIFMFKASAYLGALRKHRPDILAVCEQAMIDATNDLDFIRLDDVFHECATESIDNAIMEKTEDGIVVPLDAGWTDIGSWSALMNIQDKDDNDNVLIGNVVSENTYHSYIRSESRLVSTLGIKNLVIVETKDSVLVVDKNYANDIKKLVKKLSLTHRKELEASSTLYRPWGVSEVIDLGTRFQVKRLRINPGAQLSSQLHYHRAEHWVVVSGTAEVTLEDDTFLVSENESTYIPVGKIHRLKNPGSIPLELIEIQSGAYLGEDDIVRFNDVYGRD